MESQMQRITARPWTAHRMLSSANTTRKPRGAGSQLVGSRASERVRVPDRSLRNVPPLDIACQPGSVLKDRMNEATALVLWATAALAIVLLIITNIWG